jgi:hypothetical protein
MVYLNERDRYGRTAEYTSPIFYEIRGLVVDKSCRGEGVGLKLIQAALGKATMSDIYVPTVAMTTNPAAARLFKKMKATTRPSDTGDYPHGGPRDDRYNNLACWSRFNYEGKSWSCSSEITPPPCDACPKYNRTAWWWPTHSARLMEELEMPEAA